MEASERPYEPPFTHRLLSTLILGTVSSAARIFLHGLNRTETHGLDKFLEVLDSRHDIEKRDCGLITVSNHLTVLDDPMIWGVLPFRYLWAGTNQVRWSLGSYDICFKNGQSSILSSFFTYANTLPTQRLAHSPFGGLFQPTMTQCIRLLSDPHKSFDASQNSLSSLSSSSSPEATETTSQIQSLPQSDPFTSAELTYSTNGTDTFPAPSAYPSRRHSWIHIFPEGMIHQHPDKLMRYFKWGIARLLLEAEPCPDLVPIWIDGMQDVMSETRSWPRPVPRAGKEVSVTFGDLVDGEETFGVFRERWRGLVEKAKKKGADITERTHGREALTSRDVLGVLGDEELMYGEEAEQLRIEVTLAVRNEVLKVRRSRGLPDEDPKRSLAETFWREGSGRRRREGQMDDKSIVKDM